MKKYLLLLAVLIYFFSIISCNSDSKTESVNTDSTNLKDTAKSDTLTPSVTISKYLITKGTFDSITKTNLSGAKNTVIDSSLKAQIMAEHNGGTIYSVKGKYRNQDTLRYASTRGMLPGSDSARVKNYKTVLYKVIVLKENATQEEFYYDVVTINPPPPVL